MLKAAESDLYSHARGRSGYSYSEVKHVVCTDLDAVVCLTTATECVYEQC